MRPAPGTSLETRPSLLLRLNSADDPQSWQEFYRAYGGLIRGFAAKAGLTPDEAEEVVQETAIGVARGLPDFAYDPKVCRFKTWLLNLTRWRIQDQLRRRLPGGPQTPAGDRGPQGRREDDTATIERIPDPAGVEFGAEWDAAWEKNLLARALERVRDRIDERQLQVFDLNVMKVRPAAEVAQTLGIGVARVYLAKHRVSRALQQEIARLEAEMARGPGAVTPAGCAAPPAPPAARS